MFTGALLMVVGTLLVALGWATLYRGVKDGELVTWGLYSVSRHPQYLGFLLVIAGWLIGWPTLLNCIFSTVLMVFYVRACRKEERELTGIYPSYPAYKARTPFLI
jgi:protein-S-isoprenylcysteine O-methyltransferase Ste14